MLPIETTGFTPIAELHDCSFQGYGLCVQIQMHHASRLSFAQQRLWFIHQMQPRAALFNLHSAVRIKVRFDVAILQRALNEIVRRHASLRTSFVSDRGDDVVQMIVPSLHLPMTTVDLSDLPVGPRESEVSRLATQDAREPFDLEHAPLLRIQLLRLAESEHVLLIAMHHIVSDGWSMGIFWKELEVLWNAFARGSPRFSPARIADPVLRLRQVGAATVKQ